MCWRWRRKNENVFRIAYFKTADKSAPTVAKSAFADCNEWYAQSAKADFAIVAAN
jgi:hypothetical protein